MVFFFTKNMQNRLLYLIEEEYVAKAIYTDSVKSIYSIKSELNKIAKNHLTSLAIYYKNVRKILHLKNKIPIFFSDSLLLFQINSKKAKYFINYFNILKICYEEKMVIIFNDGTILKLSCKKSVFKRELEKIKCIVDYRNNLNL